MRVVPSRRERTDFVLYDFEPTPDRICEDVARGLADNPKRLPSKYFYDEAGAQLFEQITELDSYYPTRTEISILESNIEEIARAIGPDAAIVEFGSGSGEKTWILLNHLDSPVAYVPVDISRAQLVEFAGRVADELSDLRVMPVCADYTTQLELPELPAEARRSVGFFPGSTIGNFEPGGAAVFLERARKLLGADAGMLLGIDLRKDPAIIERAYNDPEGVTARFNLNLLTRINRECGADFDTGGFSHHAFFDDAASRIETRIVSEQAQTVRLQASPDRSEPSEVTFEPGEYIVTEYSHKYDLERFRGLAASTGWSIDGVWMDDRCWFAVVLLR